jgi:hypothetical protein
VSYAVSSIDSRGIRAFSVPAGGRACAGVSAIDPLLGVRITLVGLALLGLLLGVIVGGGAVNSHGGMP